MNVYSMDALNRMRSDIVVIRKAVTRVAVENSSTAPNPDTDDGLVDRIINAYSSSKKKYI